MKRQWHNFGRQLRKPQQPMKKLTEARGPSGFKVRVTLR